MGKKDTMKLINWVMNNDPDDTLRLHEDLKEVGFHSATVAGISLSVDDMCVPPGKAALCDAVGQRTQAADAKYENGEITVVERSQKKSDEWSSASEEVKDEAMANFKENHPGNSVYMMSKSGARGNISQVRQLTAMRGLMANSEGKLIDVPIRHCLREGMSAPEMLISANGARKGVIDQSCRTADSGYLYRRLDFAGVQAVVKDEDCGSERTSPIAIGSGLGAPSVGLHGRLRGRVLARDLRDPETEEVMLQAGEVLTAEKASIIDHRWMECSKCGVEPGTIHVRSPLTCMLTDGICSVCYGEDLSTPGKLAKVGTPVGIIAAQSMGEPGTQLTMRTFHTGGAFEGGAGEGVKAVGAGTVSVLVNDKPLTEENDLQATVKAGTWERTSHGGVACRLEHEGTMRVEAPDGKTVLGTFELLKGSLVRVQDGEEVTQGQVLYAKPPEDDVEPPEMTESMMPIRAVNGGRVVVTTTKGELGCVPKNASLVWVLECDHAEVEEKAGRALAVHPGDVISEGVSMAAEWVSTEVDGVQRFMTLPLGGVERTPSDTATGLSQQDWLTVPPETTQDWADTNLQLCRAATRSGSKHLDRRLHARTDYDWLPLASGRVTAYTARCNLPESLRGTIAEFNEDEAGHYISKQQLAEMRSTNYSCDVTVLSHSANEAVSQACSLPSTSTAAGLLQPARRTAAEGGPARGGCVFPGGGLVLHARHGGARYVAWAPEEVFPIASMDLMRGNDGQRLLRQLYEQSGSEGRVFPEGSGSPLVTAAQEGVLCVYGVKPQGRLRPEVVEEASGALVRKNWDRVTQALPDDIQALEEVGKQGLEAVVKPGVLLRVESRRVRTAADRCWVDNDALGRGVHLHSKLVPPGEPVLDGKGPFAGKPCWRIFELLDDPNVAQTCRVLVRPVIAKAVPEDEVLSTPSGLDAAAPRAFSTWVLPQASGEVVTAQRPLVAAYETLCTAARHVDEPHCVSAGVLSDEVALNAPVVKEGRWGRVEEILKDDSGCRVRWNASGDAEVVAMEEVKTLTRAASEAGRASGQAGASFAAAPSVDLAVEQEWSAGQLCAVQHTPERVVDYTLRGWSEPDPVHLAPSTSPEGRAAVARRLRPSTVNGWVCSVARPATEEESRPVPDDNDLDDFDDEATAAPQPPASSLTSLSIVRPKDLLAVRCREPPTCAVGALVRRGDRLSEHAGDVAPHAGQVLFVETDGDGFRVTLRKAQVYLVTINGNILVKDGSVVHQGDLIGNELKREVKTADIVQGLPKIEKLFEAAGGIAANRLKALWISRLEEMMKEGEEQVKHLAAAYYARDEIQLEMVKDIQAAYFDQGVFVHSKHIEIVVAIMTMNCSILGAPPGTFPLGSLVTYTDFEALAALNPSGNFSIRPAIRGITDIGRNNHVLASLGYRETANILTREALRGQSVHSLNGIKENLMVGKMVALGDRVRPGKGLWSDDQKQEELNLSDVPDFGDPCGL